MVWLTLLFFSFLSFGAWFHGLINAWWLVGMTLALMLIGYGYFRYMQTLMKNFVLFLAVEFFLVTGLFFTPFFKAIISDLLGVVIPTAPDPKIYLTFVLGVIAFLAYDIITKELKQRKNSSTQSPKPKRPRTLPDIDRLPIPTAAMVGRTAALNKIKAALKNKHTDIYVLVAGGGVGKSTLTYAFWEWLKKSGMKEGKKIFAWSFYSQSGDNNHANDSSEFFRAALRYFGESEIPKDVGEQGRVLLEHLHQGECILFLDGLEPLQNPTTEQGGTLLDAGMKAFLERVNRYGIGGEQNLVLISSRQPVAELVQAEHCQHEHLGDLSLENSLKLLADLGCQGTAEDLEKLCKDLSYHALALVLFARLVADASLRERLPTLLEDETDAEGQHARRVLRFYAEGYWREQDETERALLYLLALFDRPMGYRDKEILFEEADLAKPLAGLNAAELNKVEQHLQQAGLLLPAEGRRKNWDTHPLIRSFFADWLQSHQSKAYQQAHQVLFEHYQAFAVKEPQDVTDLQPLYKAVGHGTRAGQYGAAFEVYYFKILQAQTGNGFSTQQLGAYAQDLSVLAGFYQQPWQRPRQQLSVKAQAALLSFTANCLKALGRLQEALVPEQMGLNMDLAQQRWDNAAIVAQNVTLSEIALGKLADAELMAHRALVYTEQTKDLNKKITSQAYLARCLHLQGQLPAALESFEQAEATRAQAKETPQLYSSTGLYYALLLADSAEDKQALAARGDYLLTRAQETQCLLCFASAHIVIAESSQQAADFDIAVKAMQAANTVYHMPLALLARARCLRQQGNIRAAQADIDESLLLAERCQLGLHRIDALLLQAHIDLDSDKDAHTVLETCEELNEHIQVTSYGLRQPELDLLRLRAQRCLEPTADFSAEIAALRARIEDMGYLALLERLDSELGALVS